MEIVEIGGETQWRPTKKRQETKKTDKCFFSNDTLTKEDCVSFDDKDQGQRLTTKEGTFRPVGKVRGDVGNGPKFLTLLAAVSAKKSLPREYYLYDDGERIQPPGPEEIDEPYSHRLQPGTPKLIPVHFFQES